MAAAEPELDFCCTTGLSRSLERDLSRALVGLDGVIGTGTEAAEPLLPSGMAAAELELLDFCCTAGLPRSLERDLPRALGGLGGVVGTGTEATELPGEFPCPFGIPWSLPFGVP